MAMVRHGIELKGERLFGDDFADRANEMAIWCELAIRIGGFELAHGAVDVMDGFGQSDMLQVPNG